VGRRGPPTVTAQAFPLAGRTSYASHDVAERLKLGARRTDCSSTPAMVAIFLARQNRPPRKLNRILAHRSFFPGMEMFIPRYISFGPVAYRRLRLGKSVSPSPFRTHLNLQAARAKPCKPRFFAEM